MRTDLSPAAKKVTACPERLRERLGLQGPTARRGVTAPIRPRTWGGQRLPGIGRRCPFRHPRCGRDPEPECAKKKTGMALSSGTRRPLGDTQQPDKSARGHRLTVLSIPRRAEHSDRVRPGDSRVLRHAGTLPRHDSPCLAVYPFYPNCPARTVALPQHFAPPGEKSWLRGKSLAQTPPRSP